MTKKIAKMLIVALLAVVLVMSLSQSVFAEYSFGKIEVDTVTKTAKDNSGAAKSVNNILGAILTIVQVVGTGVAVIMLVVLAIKYISAAPGDKADIKKHAVVYVVGAVVLFAASGILQIVKKFASNVQPT